MEDGRIHQGAVIEIDHHSFTFSGFAKHLGLSPLNRCFDIDEIREDEDRVVMEGMYTVEDATLTLSWDAEGQVIADAVGCDVFGWTVTVPVIRASSSRHNVHP